MKKLERIFKKVMTTALVMLVLQPLLGLAVLPAKTYAATYEMPAATQKAEGDTTTGSFACAKEPIPTDSCGMHVNKDEILYVDTFAVDGVDSNKITSAKLKLKYKTEAGYSGTSKLEFSAEGGTLVPTTILPVNNPTYTTQEFDLFGNGIDTKTELENLDVKFENNSTGDSDVIIDYLWIEVATDGAAPDVTLNEKPNLLTKERSAHFSWEGSDNVTASENILYSYKIDTKEWSTPAVRISTADFSGLAEGPHTFYLSAKDDNVEPNEKVITYEWTVDITPPGEVTGLTATPGNNRVTLNWTNPDITLLANVDFDGVNIYRSTVSGEPGSKLNTSVILGTNFSDITALNGTTYYYTAKTVDEAGNKSPGPAQVPATPAAPVVLSPSAPTPPAGPVAPKKVIQAVAVSDVPTYYSDGSEISQGDVKADASDSKEEEQKEEKTEVKDKKSVPLWAVIFLLILAGIGGYLFYSQGPDKSASKK